MNKDSAHVDPMVRGYLAALPEAEPPRLLRPRVLAALPAARPPRSRRRPLLLGLAAAAALAMLGLGLRLALPPAPSAAPGGLAATAPAAAVQATTASAMDVAQALEHRVLDRGMAADPALRAGIAGIDRALAEAYGRDAAAEELDALWRARSRALDAIDKGLTTAPVVPARI